MNATLAQPTCEAWRDAHDHVTKPSIQKQLEHIHQKAQNFASNIGKSSLGSPDSDLDNGNELQNRESPQQPFGCPLVKLNQ